MEERLAGKASPAVVVPQFERDVGPDPTTLDGNSNSKSGGGGDAESALYWHLAIADSSKVGCGQAVVRCLRTGRQPPRMSCDGSDNLQLAAPKSQRAARFIFSMVSGAARHTFDA